jgi:molybdopterin synthase catalytic subunit
MKPFALSAEPIGVAPLRAQLESARAGAVVCFEGLVRENSQGRAVTALEYHAYLPLAEREGACILDEAAARFAIERALCVHRVGRLAIGELAVWVGVAAAHRDEAFAACRYVIDETKRRVPIWKREHYVDGPADWVDPDGQPRR